MEEDYSYNYYPEGCCQCCGQSQCEHCGKCPLDCERCTECKVCDNACECDKTTERL